MKIEIGFLHKELKCISKILEMDGTKDTLDIAYAKGRLDGLLILLENNEQYENDTFKDSSLSKTKKVFQERKDTIHDCVYHVQTLLNLIIIDSSLENKETYLQFKHEINTEIDCESV